MAMEQQGRYDRVRGYGGRGRQGGRGVSGRGLGRGGCQATPTVANSSWGCAATPGKTCRLTGIRPCKNGDFAFTCPATRQDQHHSVAQRQQPPSPVRPEYDHPPVRRRYQAGEPAHGRQGRAVQGVCRAVPPAGAGLRWPPKPPQPGAAPRGGLPRGNTSWLGPCWVEAPEGSAITCAAIGCQGFGLLILNGCRRCIILHS